MKQFSSFTPEVVRLLKAGKIGIIPTDTVYGIVGLLENPAAVERIYQLKSRPHSQPVGTIIFSDPLQLRSCVTPGNLQIAKLHWAAATSVILEVNSKLAYAYGDAKSLPFRLQRKGDLHDVLQQTGPLATTSANHTGQQTVSTIEEARELFLDTVDFYVDGGDLSQRLASRIIKLEEDGSTTIIR